MRRTLCPTACLLMLCAVVARVWPLDGYVVLLREDFTNGPLEILNVGTNERTTLDNGSCFGPCFSPDGKKVAYNKNNKIYIRNADGSGSPTVVDVYSNSGREPAMNWVRLGSSDYIYWSEQSKQIYRVKVGTTNKETVHTSSKNLYMVSVNDDGTKAACSKASWSCWAIDIGGAERNLGGGCQGTVSPNGQYVTHNLSSHTKAEIHNHSTGNVLKTITSPTGEFNQHRFSHASDEWVVFTVNGNKAYLCKWRENQSYSLGSGSPWDYYPGTIGPSDPAMALSPKIIEFAAETGDNATTPASAVVTVANSGGGTLDAVTLSGVPSWLSVNVDASSRNSQKLTNTVDPANVSQQKTYTGTVTVNCGNASPAEVSYDVKLVVSAAPVFTSVEISPASATTTPGGTVEFFATALDQNDKALSSQPSFDWSLGGEGRLSGGTYTAPEATGGPYTVKASCTIDAVTKTGSAEVTVADYSLRVNCGNNTYDVAGWERDDNYASGGGDYTFGTVNTGSGADNEAPADIYKSCRHQTPHTYTFANVPNGTYTLRLHLVINSTDRSFTFKAEGTTLKSGWNPAPTNDLVNTAQVHDFQVEVADGNGLTLECSSTAGDVFECGIEIIGTSTPPIQVVAPNGGEKLVVGRKITVEWNGDCNEIAGVELKISPDNGKSWVSIDATGTVNCGTANWERYEWTIPATLGGISLVSDQCLVMVTEYNGPAKDMSDATFEIASGATVMRGTHAANPRTAPSPRRTEGHYTITAPAATDATIFDIRGAVVGHAAGARRTIATAPGLHVVRETTPKGRRHEPRAVAE